jgi:predicted RNase H-like HicB family nuclease
MKKRSPRSSSTLHLQVLIEIDEDSKYVASCPALQGCHAQGDTFEEALLNIKDVIDMCVEELREAA